MPPKAKFTREQIVKAALDIVERDGSDALTARAMGQALKSSARPIFTVFDSMDEVRAAAVAAAKSVYAEYVARGLAETPAFKGVGTEYIRFAAEKPKLFRLLFMSERDGATDVNTVLGAIDDSAPAILQSVIDGYSLDRDAAERLYLHLWLYAHGIAALIATGVCEFTAGDISDMLTSVFVGMLAREREKNL